VTTSIILLNWNGWKDTIECLESLFNLRDSDFRVVVCDNASTDGSTERIKEWASGTLPAQSANPELARLILPEIPKPLAFREMTREQSESDDSNHDERLVLIQTGANLGFAGGCNVGLRYALRDGHSRFFWLLNNDTVVEPDALATLVAFVQQRPGLGICGSLNLSYYNPNLVQTEGGKLYSPWTGRVRKTPSRTVSQLKPGNTSRIDFVNGASMLVSRAFLEKIGLMEESYFLYFEELDWARRAKGRFSLGYCAQSVIYHKEGGSIGSNTNRSERSILSDKYLSHSRVLFTKRFYPWALPTVLVAVCLAAGYRLCRGDAGRAYGMLVLALQGLVRDGERVEERDSG